MPVSAHPAHVSTPAQSAPCLFPAQAGLLSISGWLLILSPGLNALVPIPFPSGCQHILQNGPKSSHTRTTVLVTSVSRFWSFQIAQIKNPAWALFFLRTPDSWGPLCTNGGSYREVCVLVTQSCPMLCDPMDCSPPGSPVHEILQARILEWVAIPFSSGSSQPRD